MHEAPSQQTARCYKVYILDILLRVSPTGAMPSICSCGILTK